MSFNYAFVPQITKQNIKPSSSTEIIKKYGDQEPDRQKRFSANGQVKGEYEAMEKRMKIYLTVIQTLLSHFKKVEFLQIVREENVEADRLTRLASSGEEIDGFLEVYERLSIEKKTMNSIMNNTSWMSPIIHYFTEGKLPTNKTEARKLRIRASHF